MTPHPFRPRGEDAPRRIQCAETGCLLTPDQHLEAMAAAPKCVYGEHRTQARCPTHPLDEGGPCEPEPRRRGPALTRQQRIAKGLPVCAASETCPRTVAVKGRCKRCWEELTPQQRAAILREARASVVMSVRFRAATHEALTQRAAKAGTVPSRWVREVVEEALNVEGAS